MKSLLLFALLDEVSRRLPLDGLLIQVFFAGSVGLDHYRGLVCDGQLVDAQLSRAGLVGRS